MVTSTKEDKMQG